MDPNVQVALISVLATFVTTLGVIAVAIINNRKERAGAAAAGVRAGLEEREVLEKMLALIAENDRKEKQIQELKLEIRDCQQEHMNLLARLIEEGEGHD